MMPAAAKKCECFLIIPTDGKYGVLNLCTAASIVLYEYRRKHRFTTELQLKGR
jgi:tRNA C32,U32 (ribose-2'-O)-methylase TrmJ